MIMKEISPNLYECKVALWIERGVIFVSSVFVEGCPPDSVLKKVGYKSINNSSNIRKKVKVFALHWVEVANKNYSSAYDLGSGPEWKERELEIDNQPQYERREE